VNRPPVASVDKALRALTAVAAAGPTGTSLGDLSERLGTGKSGLHATLSALRYRGFVRQIPETGHYALGEEVRLLAKSYMDSIDVRALVRPALLELNAEINEVCHVGLLVGTDLVYIDKMESQRPIQAGTHVGLRIPALTTAMGRALIAAGSLNAADFTSRFGDALVRRTDRAPRTLEDAWSHIEFARTHGYALDLQENIQGLNAVSVAVMNAGRPAVAISIVTLASEDGEDGPQRYLPQLVSILTRSLRTPLHLVAESSGPVAVE